MRALLSIAWIGAEPGSKLFQAPVDYTIVDEKGSFTMTVPRR